MSHASLTVDSRVSSPLSCGPARSTSSVSEMWGTYGPIGRCPSLSTPSTYRQVSHRPSSVDETLFGSTRSSANRDQTAGTHAAPTGGCGPEQPATPFARPRPSVSAIQRQQTRFRFARTRSSHVDDSLFAPMSKSRFWSAMEEWYEPGDFNFGKHGLFDTKSTKIVLGSDVKACLSATRMRTGP